MDQIEKLQCYRTILQQVLETQAALPSDPDGSEELAVCDPVSGNYLLLAVGWEAGARVHYVLAHLRLQDGKVLIEKDGIEDGIEQDLLAAGIPAADLIIAWRSTPALPRQESVAA